MIVSFAITNRFDYRAVDVLVPVILKMKHYYL